MGLEGEAPAGMGEGVGDGGAQIAFGSGGIAGHVAWLQTPFGGYGHQRRVAVHRLPAVNHLQLIDAVENHRGILGRTCNPVDRRWERKRAVCFHLHEAPCGMQCVNECAGELYGRFAPGDNHVARRECRHMLHHLGIRHPDGRMMVGVAERTPEVASRQAHEHCRRSGEMPLALQGVKYLVDTQKPLSAATAAVVTPHGHSTQSSTSSAT